MQRIFTRRKSGQYDDNNSADELYCMYITNLDIPIVGNVLGGEGISPPPSQTYILSLVTTERTIDNEVKQFDKYA